MKTPKIIAIKTIGTLVLLIAFSSFTSCQSQDKKVKNEKNDSTITQTKIETPNVDIHTATFLGNLETVNQHIKAGTNLDIKINMDQHH